MPVPALVTAAKFRGRLNSVRLLGQLLAERVAGQALPRPEVLVPVPLHPSRLAERGYNQALEIARVTGRLLGLGVAPHCCRRVTATPPQVGLDEAARRRNLRGAFAADRPLPWTHVAIVDDVVTTASTVTELTRVLQRAGAGVVEVWAVARTP
jgi:ComF family protein